MHYIFLDESGEFGFSEGSSSHLLIALLDTPDPKRLKNVMRKEKKRLHDLGWPKDLEIKGTNLFSSDRNPNVPRVISENKNHHIARIITRILSVDVRPNYSIVNKSRIAQNLRNAPYGIAYNFFAGNLLCKLHNRAMNFDTTLVVDQRNKETHAHMPFDGYIQTRIITDCNHEHAFEIRHEESHLWLGLQAVDFISWGLFRLHEHKDKTFSELIKPSIHICDSWYA